MSESEGDQTAAARIHARDLLGHNPTRHVQKDQGNRICYTQPGHIATHSAIAEVRRAATQAKQAEALCRWNPSELPKWLDEDSYRREILPRLCECTVKKIRLSIDVSHPYATLIRRGEKIPHPRHWLLLARLVDVS